MKILTRRIPTVKLKIPGKKQDIEILWNSSYSFNFTVGILLTGSYRFLEDKNAKNGKSFRDIPWVSALFLEIVSGILYII